MVYYFMGLAGLFSIGFIMGLTGAMAPGPLLTITVGESTKRGGIVGPLIVLGHGILEITLLCLIVFGASSLFNTPKVFSAIAFFGGFVLMYMGYRTIMGLKNYSLADGSSESKKGMHPVIIGIVVSLANPYWFIWWFTIGMGYVMFAGSLGIKGIVSFFAGHILSDLAWYSFVSYGMQFGGRYISLKIIKTILCVCSIFLIVFGIFFIIKSYDLIR